MLDFSRQDDLTSASSRCIEIIHKKHYKGSTLPSQSVLKSSFEVLPGLIQLPQMRPLLTTNFRFNELEKRAKDAEEYRAEKGKIQKFDIDTINFPSDKGLPEITSEELRDMDIVFPTQVLGKNIYTKKETKKSSPLKLVRNADVPVDPGFSTQIELIVQKDSLKENRLLEEGESEYSVRIDSQGRKVTLRKVNYRNADSSQPILTTLLTLRELKARARSLA